MYLRLSLQLCLLMVTTVFGGVLVGDWTESLTPDTVGTNMTYAIGLNVAQGKYSITKVWLQLALTANTNVEVLLQGSDATPQPDGTTLQTFTLGLEAGETDAYSAVPALPFTLTATTTFWLVVKLNGIGEDGAVNYAQVDATPVGDLATYINYLQYASDAWAPLAGDFLNFDIEGAAVVDCMLGNWTEWDACSADCGGGYHSHTRPILQEAQQGGEACGTTTETEACNTVVCPVNCSLSAWTEWTNCTVTCGGGVTTHTRSVVVQPVGTGLPCGATMETQTCNTAPCPVNCSLGAWTEWTNCTVACGGGMKTHTRPIDVQPVGTGLPCGATQESQTCNTNPCPVDCAVGDWSAWTGCLCDYHVAGRARSITTPASGGGVACPATYETRACEAGSCQSPSPGKLPKDPSTSPDNAAPSLRPSFFAMLLSLIAFVALLR